MTIMNAQYSKSKAGEFFVSLIYYLKQSKQKLISISHHVEINAFWGALCNQFSPVTQHDLLKAWIV
jgi:hypothetical protein